MGAVDATAAPAAVAVPSELAALCPAGDEPQLDANRLHVYHVALELHCLCSTLVATLNRIIKDQLERPRCPSSSTSPKLVVVGPGATRPATTRSPVALLPRRRRFSMCWCCGG